MRIAELYASRRPVFSFEFFPPRSDAGYRSLYRSIGELERLRPGFVSVTCGAAGSTRRKTADLVIRIQREIGITAMAHMVCTGQTAAELSESLDRMEREGIANLLALRGDPPRDRDAWQPVDGGFAHASDLVAFIRSRWHFCVGGASYPETHPEAESPEADLAHLALKVHAGAEFLLTQLFFENEDYWRFAERVRSAGIEVPVVPGIMPVVSLQNLRRIAALSPGSKIPRALEEPLVAAGGDGERALAAGVEWATAQCRDLLDGGAPGIHFYTLNQSPATRRVYENLFPGGAPRA